jgi:hypothetical protein
LKQLGPSACSARGGVIAICAPHRAHDTEGNNTNTNTDEAPEILTNRQKKSTFAAFPKRPQRCSFASRLLPTSEFKLDDTAGRVPIFSISAKSERTHCGSGANRNP